MLLPTYQSLRDQLMTVLANKQEQGHIVIGLAETLANLPDSYDALATFARSLTDLPKEVDWPFDEPNTLDAIWYACDPDRPLGVIATIDPDESARRVEAGFLASVCGCMLGKPIEVNPTLDELRDALMRTDAWPLNDYIAERTLLALGRRHSSWVEAARERIDSVAPDDDINYTVLAMMLLEQPRPRLHAGGCPRSLAAPPADRADLRAGADAAAHRRYQHARRRRPGCAGRVGEYPQPKGRAMRRDDPR